MKNYTVEEIREILEGNENCYTMRAKKIKSIIINGITINYEKFIIETDTKEEKINFYTNNKSIAKMPISEIKSIIDETKAKLIIETCIEIIREIF